MLAIVGAGSLGQTFAACLAASGQPVALLATPGTAARLREARRIRLHGAIDQEVPVGSPDAPVGMVGLTDDPAALPREAGLIFTTKGHQLEAAARAVAAAGYAPDWVAGVQNGIVKDDVLADVFGQDRVVGAVTIVGAQREPEGRIAVASRGATYLGELSGDRSARAEAAASALVAAGLPTEAVTNIQTVLWSKMCNATGFFAVTCLARISTNRFGHYPELVRAYMGLVRETAAIAAAQGIPMGDYPGFPIKSYLARSDEANVAWFAERAAPFTTTPGAPESRTSMYQDLLAGRPLEVEAIYADVVARAERVGVPAPRLALARDLLRAIDPGRASR